MWQMCKEKLRRKLYKKTAMNESVIDVGVRIGELFLLP
jgi:hypothetical protein